MNIGMNGTIGIVDSRPMRSAPHPHWNTITMTPNAAPTLSRLSSAALMGTTTDRNTRVSSSTDSTITAPMNSGSRLFTLSPTSAKLAVCPPMWARAGPCPSTDGMTSTRRRSTVSRVALS